MKRVSVSLLVFNEKHNLEDTIAKAYNELEKLNFKYELWIFDNCSTDGTDKLLESLLKKYKYLKYFRQKKNFGYSVNFQTALKVPDADYKFVIDGDGQYDLANIKDCIKILDTGYDIVVGIRKSRKDPKIRILMSFILKYLSKIILKSNLEDINTGYRCMTKECADKINLKCKYNFANPEMFALSVILKLKIAEKIVNHYPRKGGQGEFSSFKNSILNSLLMIKHIFDLRNEIKKSK